MRIKTLLFLFLTCLTPLKSDEIPLPLYKPALQPTIIMTIPKSGTHLMRKLIYLLTGETYGIPRLYLTPEKEVDEVRKLLGENGFVISHTTLNTSYRSIRETNPEIPMVLLVRDLRDVCVSQAFYFRKKIDRHMKKTATMDERLMWVITNGFDPGYRRKIDTLINLPLVCDTLMSWFDEDNVAILRFEDLCGPKGGGTLQAQKKAILSFAQRLDISLSDEELDRVADELWGKGEIGISYTFRRGKIGGWREYFKPDHIEEFKKRMGTTLIELGYEKDYDW